MKKLAVLVLALLLIPSVFAVIGPSFKASMQTNLITQGNEFARIQGMNHNSVPVEMLKWSINAELGRLYSFCEMQPTILPPGPFEVEVSIQCQTRSQFTTLYPTGTLIDVRTIVPAEYDSPFTVERVWITTTPQVPTAFPTGQAVLVQQASSTGTVLFVAGMAGIIILTLAVVILSLRRR